MTILKKIFEFYILSNLHVAIAILSFTYLTMYEFNISEYQIMIFNFLATFITYNFIRYYAFETLNNYTKQWLRNNKIIMLLLIFFSSIWLIQIFLSLKITTQLLLIPLIFASFFYVVPLPYFQLKLRHIASIKLFLIALTVTGATVALPLIQNNIESSSNSIIVYVQRFLFVLAVTIPFDIRDVKNDNSDLRTLPQLIGVVKSKIIGVISLILFLILELFKQPLSIESIIITAFITIVSLIFLKYSNENRKFYYTAFWVEAIPVFWMISLIILK